MNQERVFDVTHLFPKEKSRPSENAKTPTRAEVDYTDKKISHLVTSNELCRNMINLSQDSVAASALLRLPKKAGAKDAKVRRSIWARNLVYLLRVAPLSGMCA